MAAYELVHSPTFFSLTYENHRTPGVRSSLDPGILAKVQASDDQGRLPGRLALWGLEACDLRPDLSPTTHPFVTWDKGRAEKRLGLHQRDGCQERDRRQAIFGEHLL